jgi:hypothetical protein
MSAETRDDGVVVVDVDEVPAAGSAVAAIDVQIARCGTGAGRGWYVAL